MSSENNDRPRGLSALVYAELPEGAIPVETACHPLPRRVLDRAGSDVIDVTKRKIGEVFDGQPHIVIEIRDGDLDPSRDGEVLGLLEQTGGGVVVFGVSYELGSVSQTESPA